MQLNPQIRLNNTKVLDCLAGGLDLIRPANGYITDGVTTDRLRDIRRYRTDPAAGVRETGTYVRIIRWDAETVYGSKGPIGDTRRKERKILLQCKQALAKDQDEAWISTDQIQEWLEKDIECMIARDPELEGAAAYLNTIAGPWGGIGTFGGPPCVINLHLFGVVAVDVVVNNLVEQTIILDYLEDTHGPNCEPGS